MKNPSPAAIKRLRKQAELTQTQAAALVHSCRSAWAAWESGVNVMPLVYWELFTIKVA